MLVAVVDAIGAELVRHSPKSRRRVGTMGAPQLLGGRKLPYRHVSLFVAAIVVAVAITTGPVSTGDAAQRAVASTSADIPACDLRLPEPTGGEPRFAIPRGGRATLRALAGGFRLCRLLRADGSRFAQAEIDRLRQVLELRFFRRSGTLLFAADSQFPAKTTTEGADVGCNNDAYGTIGARQWQQPHKWWVGKTPSGLAADKVVQALRSAYSEWTNNVNWCDLPDNAKAQSDYQGRTELKAKHDGKSVVHWGSLEDVQNCSGALACAATWYDEQGNPVESDIRFSTAEKWSISPKADSFDVQSVAAHEFGHVRQFDHVTGGDNTVVMWPYISKGDTSLRKLGRGDSRGNNTKY